MANFSKKGDYLLITVENETTVEELFEKLFEEREIHRTDF